MFRDVGDFRHGEAGTAAADATPGGAALGIAEHHLLAGFGEVAEQAAACDAAARHEDIALDLLGRVAVDVRHECFGFIVRAELADVELRGERAARGGVAHDLHTVTGQ